MASSRGSMMIRDWSPRTTWPAMAGASGVVAGPFDRSVATSISRMPPRAGAGNSCDSRCSPSTSAIAFTVAFGVRSLNCARPLSSVFTVSTLEPTRSSTGWLAMLFDSSPRIRRTETAPFGRSSTGRGIPAICFGSGCAPTSWRAAQRTQRKQRTQRERPVQPFLATAQFLPIKASPRILCRTSRRRRSPRRSSRTHARPRSAKASAERSCPGDVSPDPVRFVRDSRTRHRADG